MDSFNWLAEWFYSEGDVLMMMCKLCAMLFVMEVFAYIISIIAHATRTGLR